MTGSGQTRTQPPARGYQRWPWILLALVMLVALACRLYRLVPPQAGLLYAQDADEGVYATTAQLMLQGYLPYRDFFTPMPPLAIYLFMSVLRVCYHPWGSAMGLMALRYVSVGLGLMAVFVVFLIGKLIGGSNMGLLSAAILAVDGIVVAQDRRAMLESPTNLFSSLAVLCYLHAMRQAETQQQSDGRWLQMQVAGAGAFCAAGLLVKGTALVPPLLIIGAILIRRRWREVGWFIVSFLLVYVLCAAVFLINCPEHYLKQMYLFHMLRPWDGTVHPLARLREMWGYPWSWTTIRIAAAGLATTVLMGRKARNRDLWFVILAWAGLVVLLLLSSRTYWATYFSQLAVPLAILGGAVLNQGLDFGALGLRDRLAISSQRRQTLAQVMMLIVLMAIGIPQLERQYGATRDALEQTKPAYLEISDYIQQNLPLDARILTFETNYTFLSSRPPAGVRDGSFFIDSYGEMLYRNLGIADSSIPELLSSWVGQKRTGATDVFHRQPAQEDVLTVFSRAPYLVLDGRALKQLAPATSAFLYAHSQVIKGAPAVELRARVPE
jgi:4-amino-4-deoxy-L-arabinose transferase-like glycosyltransferase